MGNAVQQPIAIEISAITAKQIEQFENFIPQYETLQMAMFEVEGLLDDAQVDKTKNLIGEAIHTGEIKSDAGAIIPYSLWIDISEKYQRAHKSKAGSKNPFSPIISVYHTRSSAIGWYYTQIVVVPLPSFNLEKEWPRLNLKTFPFKLMENFQGLPLYMPIIKNSHYAGVLVTIRVDIAAMQETIATLAGIDDPKLNLDLTRIFSWTFELIAKQGHKNASVWIPTYESFQTKEALEIDRGNIYTQDLITLISQRIRDPNVVKVCKSAIQSLLYLYAHLPDSQWMAIHKKIALSSNPDTGSIEAVPPEQTPFVVLTKEGSFPLFDPHYVLQIKDDK